MGSKIPHDVEKAIAASMARGAIVVLDFSEERASALLGLCDDWDEGNDVCEYWATDDGFDGEMIWRVHLTR